MRASGRRPPTAHPGSRAPQNIHACAVGKVGPHQVVRLCAQARNDARVAVAGSLDMFSNRFLQAPVDTAAQGPRRGGPPLQHPPPGPLSGGRGVTNFYSSAA